MQDTSSRITHLVHLSDGVLYATSFIDTSIARISIPSISLILPGTSASAQGGTTVSVNPALSYPQVNETLTVLVKADNVTNLVAFEIHLTFNAAVLEVTQISNGGLVAPDFVTQNLFDNGAGTIDYAAAQIDRTPASSNGTLLEIVSRARSTGKSQIALRSTDAVPTGVLLSDAKGTAIPISINAVLDISVK